jgi:hypothetical protein
LLTGKRYALYGPSKRMVGETTAMVTGVMAFWGGDGYKSSCARTRDDYIMCCNTYELPVAPITFMSASIFGIHTVLQLGHMPETFGSMLSQLKRAAETEGWAWAMDDTERNHFELVRKGSREARQGEQPQPAQDAGAAGAPGHNRCNAGDAGGGWSASPQ